MSLVYQLRLPTVERVQEQVDIHKTALNVAKTIATCLLKESESWLSNIKALLKAKDEEKKATEKALAKAQKDEEKRIEREENKAKRAEERAAKRQRDQEAAKNKEQEQEPLDDDDNDDDASDEPDQNKKRRRQRRTANKVPLTDEDPDILREMTKLPGVYSSFVAYSVKDLVENIITGVSQMSVGRFRKGSLKKVLADSCLH